VWQLGVVLFVLLHGQFPFSGKEEISFEDPDVSGYFSSGKS